MSFPIEIDETVMVTPGVKTMIGDTMVIVRHNFPEAQPVNVDVQGAVWIPPAPEPADYREGDPEWTVWPGNVPLFRENGGRVDGEGNIVPETGMEPASGYYLESGRWQAVNTVINTLD